MRSITLANRWRVRRSMVVWRKAIHSVSIWRSDLSVGRPSSPIMVRLIGLDVSRLVCASSVLMSSCWPILLVLGSHTRRTAASLLDSSRTPSSTDSTRGLELVLLQRQGFFARLDLGVGQLFNFFQHALGADTGRQLGHHQLPLAARQFFDLPAGPAFQRAAPAAIGLGNVGGAADDLAATGKVRAGQQGEQFIVRQVRRLDQRHAGIGHLAQVVARDFGGQAHGNAAGAVEQGKGQARRQLVGLFGGAVVVG